MQLLIWYYIVPRHTIGLINQFAIVKVNTQLIHH